MSNLRAGHPAPSTQGSAFEEQVAAGTRFTFGENWRRFLAVLDERRIGEAERSLQAMLDADGLHGRTFLDVGSGSGLFSLAARRLGARVHSFDFDPSSVWCTTELRRRFAPDTAAWTIDRASVLDASYVSALGQYDIVYSWGVLHHTGDMWKAFEAVASCVEPGGKLFIAIYNDQGRWSRYWRTIKRTYCRLPRPLKGLVLYPSGFALLWRRTVLDIVRLRPFETLREYHRSRGMSVWRDVVDWVGGYPFEVAKPEEVFDFFRALGFRLTRLRTVGGSVGNNEFVFERVPGDALSPQAVRAIGEKS